MRYQSIICQSGPFLPDFPQQAQACTSCRRTQCLCLTSRLENSVRGGIEGMQQPRLPLGTLQVVNQGPLQAQAGHVCRQAGIKSQAACRAGCGPARHAALCLPGPNCCTAAPGASCAPGSSAPSVLARPLLHCPGKAIRALLARRAVKSSASMSAQLQLCRAQVTAEPPAEGVWVSAED